MLKKDYDFTQAKKEWREFCETEPSVTLYQQPWYWDATCDSPDDWRVILVKKDGEIEAAFPFVYVRRKFMWFIETPWQVPASGIWMRKRREDFRSIETDFIYLQEIVDEVVDQFPYFDRFSIGFDSRLWSWQPFYWQGFEARTHYTMIIPAQPEEKIKAKCSKKRRWKLNKAEKDYHIEINILDMDGYWDFFEKSSQSRKREISFSKKKLLKLFSAASAHHAMKVRSVYKRNETIVAENIVFLDNDRVYHHFVTQMQDEDKEASSLAVYDAICDAMREGKIFDFEGTMIKGAAHFNLHFQPAYETLYIITKESNKYKFLNGIRQTIFALRDYIRGAK